MLIDWFTVAVQIVNFLILIALLKRFLYGPILRVMDERQKAIDGSLAKAARAEQEAHAQLAALAEERKSLASTRETLMRQAASEVESWRQAALIRLQEDIEERRRFWQRQLTEEQATFFDKLKVRLGEQVIRAAGKILTDLADERLETRIFDLFLAKVGADLAAVHQEAKGVANSPVPGALLVATGLALTPDGREGLLRQLAARFGPEKPIVFTEEPGMGFGIRLTVSDQAWEWSLAHYLEELEQDIRQALTLARKSGENNE